MSVCEEIDIRSAGCASDNQGAPQETGQRASRGYSCRSIRRGPRASSPASTKPVARAILREASLSGSIKATNLLTPIVSVRDCDVGGCW